MKRVSSALIAGMLLTLSAGSALLAAPEAATPAPQQYDAAPLRHEIYEPLWLKNYVNSDPSEPRLPSFDQAKAADFLDATSRKWAAQNGCGTCHTNIPYMIVRPKMLRTPEGEEVMAAVRKGMVRFYRENATAPLRAFYAAPAAASLAVNDALTTGKMSDETRELFHAAWKLQSPEGNWQYPLDNMLPFLERERRYVAYLFAMGAGYLPEQYKRTPEAKVGLGRLQSFIRKNMPDKPHDRAVLLWASAKSPYLLTKAEKNSYQSELLGLQNSDGGWTLPALGTWPRHDGAPNDPMGPSDGYATGLAATALCSSGFNRHDHHIVRAVAWIKQNQHQSGRWYTRSTYSNQFKGYVTNMATAYAMMALTVCQKRLD